MKYFFLAVLLFVASIQIIAQDEKDIFSDCES